MATTGTKTTGVELWIYGVPVPQGSMTSAGPYRMRHSNKGLKPWRNTIRHVASNTFTARISGPVRVVANFYLPRPKSVQKRLRPHVAPDLDKLERAIGDALEGVAYDNDSQIVSWRADKWYADDYPVGVQLIVEPA